MAAKLGAALPLGRRIEHDWRGLAMQVVRLDDLVVPPARSSSGRSRTRLVTS